MSVSKEYSLLFPLNRFLFAWIDLVVTVRNEVSKVMFLQVSVCPQGGAWSRGVPAPRGVPARGGCLLQGKGDGGGPLPSRRLLLRTVRILLECILVADDFDDNFTIILGLLDKPLNIQGDETCGVCVMFIERFVHFLHF